MTGQTLGSHCRSTGRWPFFEAGFVASGGHDSLAPTSRIGRLWRVLPQAKQYLRYRILLTFEFNMFQHVSTRTLRPNSIFLDSPYLDGLSCIDVGNPNQESAGEPVLVLPVRHQ